MVGDVSNDDTLVAEGASPAPRDAEGPLGRGDNIGRYVVLEKLGAGGMGVVYAAYDPDLDRKVALKLLFPQVGGTEVSQGRERLIREAQAMARLNHPAVVTVHDVGSHQGRVFLAMEFIDGKTLDEWLEEEHTWEEILQVYLYAARGLRAAHGKGLVHRDFKPDNVMIDGEGRVRVLDFGLARPTGEDVEPTVDDSDVNPKEELLSQEITQKGAVVGTPAYMAPEQHLGAEITEKADQFSFCVALYRGLYKQKPFEGDNPAALAMAVINGKLQAPPSGNGVPRYIENAIVRGLETKPSARFEDMGRLLHALETDPRKRIKQIGGGLAVLGAVMGVLWLGNEQTNADPVCADMQSHLDGVWDDARRGEVSSAFDKLEVAYAADTWERVEPRLEAYAEGWVEQRTDACEATRVRGEQSEDLMDKRMACLDVRLAEFGALVDVLREADAGVARRAVAAASNLPNLAECADANALLAGVKPPANSAQRQEVDKIRAQLARARGLRLVGRWDDALEGIDAARDAAEKTGYEPVIAEAWVQTGDVQTLKADNEAAEASLTRAFELAVTQRHWKIAASSSSLLAKLVGTRLERHEAGAVWTTQSLAMAQADGSIDARISAHTNAGLAKDSAGDYEAAEKHHQAALELKRQLHGPNHPSLGNSLNNLGNVAQARGDYEAANKLHVEAFDVWKTALGPNHPNLASVLNNLGIDAKRQGNYDEAIEYYEHALEVAKVAMGPDHPQVGMMLNNVANVAHDQGNEDKAREFYEKALEVFTKKFGEEHAHVGTVVANLSAVAIGQKDFEAANTYSERALAIVEATTEPNHPRVATVLTARARALLALERPVEALPFIERAKKIRIERETDPATMAEVDSALGRALWYAPKGQGRDRARAKKLLQAALDGYEADGEGSADDRKSLKAWIDEEKAL